MSIWPFLDKKFLEEKIIFIENCTKKVPQNLAKKLL